MAKKEIKKRKSQPGSASGQGRYLSKAHKKLKKSLNDLYEAEDSDPDEEKHQQRYDHVDNYEYELPSDFEDEEIDEDMAFTAEDKKLYAGWFGEDVAEDGSEDAEVEEQGPDQHHHRQQQQGKASKREFAALDSSSDDGGPEEDEDDEDLDDEALQERLEREWEEYEQQQRLQANSDADAGAAVEVNLGAEDGFFPAGSSSDEPADSGSDDNDLHDEDDDEDDLDDSQHRQDRKAGYDDTKQEVTKWQPIVKSNREAPTIRFTSARHEVPAAASTVAALVDGFTPRESDPLEAQVAALLGAAGSATTAAMEEAEEALAAKKYTIEEATARAERLAKMRHLMFYAELKSKRLAKIKSKEHHRRANKAAKRAAARAAAAAGVDVADEEAARAAAEEAEFERAKERLTLKHRNSSQWARRALKRGQAAMDDSTREALAAQLALGQQLRRKIEGKTNRHSDDEGSDGEDVSTSASEPEDSSAAATATGSGRLMSSRSQKEALAILKGLTDPEADEAGEDKKKGLFGLPFMAAFAGDDVEADFAAEKAAEVAAELPAAEVAGQLPGWGTWSNQQKEPAWMVAAKAKATAKCDAAAAARKDAQLKNVVISEKWDKKSAKYLAANLPFPFRDKDVYETAIRQPLGRQYNPDAAFRNLTRPAVLKTTGVIIEPLRFSKQVAEYDSTSGGKARSVVTVAGGMQLEGQVAGSGAGGVGKGNGKKKKPVGGGGGGGGRSTAGSSGGGGMKQQQKRLRLHEGLQG
eukprot:gene4466-4722_t